VSRRGQLGSWRVSPSWGGRLARCLSVGTHGAGRCRRAVAPHLPPARPPAVTHPRWPRLQEPPGRPPARGMLSPRKFAVKGTAYGRVPPLRSGQTPDSELPRQGRRLPGGRRESRASTQWNEYSLGSCSHPRDANVTKPNSHDSAPRTKPTGLRGGRPNWPRCGKVSERPTPSTSANSAPAKPWPWPTAAAWPTSASARGAGGGGERIKTAA
jgi:hypothetical protein